MCLYENLCICVSVCLCVHIIAMDAGTTLLLAVLLLFAQLQSIVPVQLRLQVVHQRQQLLDDPRSILLLLPIHFGDLHGGVRIDLGRNALLGAHMLFADRM